MNYEVEVRHDTTMWNEGFEQARKPLVVVVVGHRAQAHQLMDLVSYTTKANDRAREWGRLFESSIRETTTPALSYGDAMRRVTRALREWEGI